MTRDRQGQRRQEIRTFRTMTRDLLALRDWLQDQGCTQVVMESTGVYWKPIFNLLEGDLTVVLEAIPLGYCLVSYGEKFSP